MMAVTACASKDLRSCALHDLSGVWMMRNPPGSNRGFTNFTYTDPKADPPLLTAWGEEHSNMSGVPGDRVVKLVTIDSPQRFMQIR
jgi:hypothetical protein